MSHEPEATLVMRSHLEAHKISCWICNDNHMSIDPTMRVRLGVMQLHVLDVHQEEASEIIHTNQT